MNTIIKVKTLQGLVLAAAVLALGWGAGLVPVAPAMAAEAAPHFCYDDSQHCGPSHWGHLADEWKACSDGTRQSGIDITAPTDGRLTSISFNWKATPLVIKNNGHTLQVNYAPGSTMTVNGVTYNLLQFHFHTPSEHTLSGNIPEPMEVHFVHVSQEGVLAVIGVLMTSGNANSALQAILNNAPKEEGEVTIAGATISGSSFLPKDRKYYTYTGSLTTPPCSEGVRWHVLQNPTNVSYEQVTEFGHFVTDHVSGYVGNARPIQPLNGRTVLKSK